MGDLHNKVEADSKEIREQWKTLAKAVPIGIVTAYITLTMFTFAQSAVVSRENNIYGERSAAIASKMEKDPWYQLYTIETGPYIFHKLNSHD